jgi:CHAD domain-containing protein
MPRLKLHKPPGDALRALARGELAAAARDLEATAQGGNVHGARKRLKFARSLLRLARDAMGSRAFAAADEALREAARGLAPARHAEALQEAIARLGEARSAAEAQALVELSAVAGAAHAMHHTPDALQQAAAFARRHVLAVRKAAAAWPIAPHDTAPLLSGLEHAYARARRLIRRGLAKDDSAMLHEARKSVIHHLHHLEMFEALWPSLVEAWTAELTALREALGDLNDLDDLAAAIARHGGIEPEAARDGAATLMAARRKALMRHIRRAAGHLFAERPAAFRRRMAAMWRHAAD